MIRYNFWMVFPSVVVVFMLLRFGWCVGVFLVLHFKGLSARLKRRTPNQHDSRLGVLRLVKISFSGVLLPPSCLVDKGFDTLALDVGRIVAFVKVD